MRAIDLGLPAIHDDPVFVWAIDVFRSQHGLPTGSYSACGCEDVVITVAFVQLRAFDRGMVYAAVKHHLSVVEKLRPVGTHAVDREYAFYAGAAVGPGMDQVGVAVIVPEWRRIDPAFCLSDQ